MNRLTPFERFGINEERSNMTSEEVKKIISKFDEDTKRNIIDFLCNDEYSTKDEAIEFLVNDLGISKEDAEQVYTTLPWFTLDYMDYCQKNGGDQGLYESMGDDKATFMQMRKSFTKPTEPKQPFKRDFTTDENHAMMKAFGAIHGWSKIDADGKIVLNGGEESRGKYYITEEDLAEIVKRTGGKSGKTNETSSNIKEKSPMNERFDVTKAPTSIAAKVEPLIGQMDKMNADEIRKKFQDVINDPKTHASEKVRAKWNQALKFAKDKISLMKTITNLYLAGARLAVNDSEKRDSGMSHLTEFERWENKK